MGWLSAVLESAGQWLGDKQKAKDAQSAAKAANKDEYMWSARLERYNAALKDYYKLRDRQETRNAAAEYGKFSSLDKWAPEYTQTYKPLQAPNAPPTGANTQDMSYFGQYTGGTNTAAGGTPPAAANATNPQDMLHDGIPGNFAEWIRTHGGG